MVSPTDHAAGAAWSEGSTWEVLKASLGREGQDHHHISDKVPESFLQHKPRAAVAQSWVWWIKLDDQLPGVSVLLF